MCKKLVVVRYLGYSDNQYDCTGGKYGYYLDTKKQIKEGDFICIGSGHGASNADHRLVSLVRVSKVYSNIKSSSEEYAEIVSGLEREPLPKDYLGKADLGEYFAEIDRKRKIEEISQRLEERFREAEKMSLYKKLAETDLEMKTLLEELEGLQK